MDTIKKKLVKFIESDLKDNQKKIDFETSLFKEGILSSLDLVALLDFIEKEFQLTVPSEDLDFKNFDKVSGIAKYIHAKK